MPCALYLKASLPWTGAASPVEGHTHGAVPGPQGPASKPEAQPGTHSSQPRPERVMDTVEGLWPPRSLGRRRFPRLFRRQRLAANGPFLLRRVDTYPRPTVPAGQVSATGHVGRDRGRSGGRLRPRGPAEEAGLEPTASAEPRCPAQLARTTRRPPVSGRRAGRRPRGNGPAYGSAEREDG